MSIRHLTARTTTTTRALAVLGASALALTLAACSGDAKPPATSDTETPAEETTQAEAPADGDLASCLIGNWELDLESVKAQLEALGEGMTVNAFDANGHSYVTIDATTWTSEVDSTSSISMEAGGQTMDMETVSKGSYTSEYTLAGDQLTQTSVVSAEGSSTTTVAGQEQVIDMADAAEASLNVPGTVTCDDSTMTFSVSGMTQTFARR
ncbi:MAG: hypothetical protein J0H73_07330 [Salana multivorans]|nr:hypothetical protein [Salana multivorans]